METTSDLPKTKAKKPKLKRDAPPRPDSVPIEFLRRLLRDGESSEAIQKQMAKAGLSITAGSARGYRRSAGQVLRVLKEQGALTGKILEHPLLEPKQPKPSKQGPGLRLVIQIDVDQLADDVLRKVRGLGLFDRPASKFQDGLDAAIFELNELYPQVVVEAVAVAVQGRLARETE